MNKIKLHYSSHKITILLLCLVLVYAIVSFALPNASATEFDVDTDTERELAGLFIDSPPNKGSYFLGESFDPSGMVVSVYYNNGEIRTLSPWEYSYPTAPLDTAGSQPVTVSYSENGIYQNAVLYVKVVDGYFSEPEDVRILSEDEIRHFSVETGELLPNDDDNQFISDEEIQYFSVETGEPLPNDNDEQSDSTNTNNETLVEEKPLVFLYPSGFSPSGQGTVRSNILLAAVLRQLNSKLADVITETKLAYGIPEEALVDAQANNICDILAVFAVITGQTDGFPYALQIRNLAERNQLETIYWSMIKLELSSQLIFGLEQFDLNVSRLSYEDINQEYYVSPIQMINPAELLPGETPGGFLSIIMNPVPEIHLLTQDVDSNTADTNAKVRKMPNSGFEADELEDSIDSLEDLELEEGTVEDGELVVNETDDDGTIIDLELEADIVPDADGMLPVNPEEDTIDAEAIEDNSLTLDSEQTSDWANYITQPQDLSDFESTGIYHFTPMQMAQLSELTSIQMKAEVFTLQNNSSLVLLSDEEFELLVSRVPSDISILRQAVLMSALSLEGRVHYFWGGKSYDIGWDNRWGEMRTVTSKGSNSYGTYRPMGLDCSGFLDWSMLNAMGSREAFNMNFDYSATAWSESYVIDWADILPGDFLFANAPGSGTNHMGIALGYNADGKMQVIHCASHENNVVITGVENFNYARRPYIYGK